MPKRKYYTADDGYIFEELFHFGIDHIASAGVLLDRHPRCYDSAGYLAHVGFELIFKAIALEAEGKFLRTHKFPDLLSLQSLGQFHFEVPPEYSGILGRLNAFDELRYPGGRQPSVTIGSEDWPSIQAFYVFVESALPELLVAKVDAISGTCKGKRTLLQKPNGGAS